MPDAARVKFCGFCGVRAGRATGFENHLRRKQRTPLARGGVVFRRAADKFVTAIGIFHEPGGAEPRDGGGLEVERGEREPTGSFYFHAASLTWGVGQWLYSLSGVVQRLGESFQGHSTTDGEQRRREKWPNCNPVINLVRAPARITLAARWTSYGQVFDRSSNPDSDTHTQVPTTHVSSIRLAPRVHN